MRHHIGLAALAAGMALALVPAGLAATKQPEKPGGPKPACPQQAGNGQGGKEGQDKQAPQGKACGRQGGQSQQQPGGQSQQQSPPPSHQGGNGGGQQQQQGPPPGGGSQPSGS